VPPLVGLHFADTFTFARPGEADYRDETGAIVTAAAGVPRFDHDEAGAMRGLLVEGGAYLGAADRISVPAGDWEIAGVATVFHEVASPDGVIRNLALYTLDARATVNALLGTAGHHRKIGACAGHLRNLGGFVRYGETLWLLPDGIGDGGGAFLADGAETARPLIEG
jgi:hypothetical protein